MKTKKQLEEEIEELEREYNYEGKSKYNKLNQLKATLTQTNEIIKLIEEDIKFYKKELKQHKEMMQRRWSFETIEETEDYLETNKDYLYVMYNSKIQVSEELLTKIKGNGK